MGSEGAPETVEDLLQQCDEQGRIIRGLKKSLDNRTTNTSFQGALATHPSSLAPER
jgi:hypothetical protein